LVDRETLPPFLVNDAIPFCMSQVTRMFSTTRIPGKEVDEVIHWDYEDSKHIVVVCNNIYYKLFVFHQSAPYGPLAPWEVEDELKRIRLDAQRQTPPNTEESNIALLTGINRTRWAEAREGHFSEGTNYQSLVAIESSLFFLHLSDKSPETYTQQGRLLICDGDHLWCDKSINVVVFNNAKSGVHCEHSWGDAVITALMWEYVLSGEMMSGYDPNGWCKRPDGATEHQFKKGREPRRLMWEMSDGLNTAIRSATLTVKEARDDLDLQVICQNTYGKGFIKKCRVSPDAYIQLMLQLAFYRDYGCFQNTYEATMTRYFRDGRTETVRPVTKYSCDFVRQFIALYTKEGGVEQGTKEEKENLKNLLRKAAEVHSHNNKDAMCGKGIDRHLFALYIVSVGRNIESPFLKQALSAKWVLSTSQQPQTQTRRWPSKMDPKKRIGPGGGFGPVADSGYGVSYMLADEDSIFFHISSKKSSPATDTARFAKNILQAFADVSKLWN